MMNDLNLGKMKQSADHAFSCPYILEYSSTGDNSAVVLLKREQSPRGDDKRYVVTNYNVESKSFYWSSYDLTLEEAVKVFYDKVRRCSV